MAELGSWRQVLGMIEDYAHVDPFLRVLLHHVLLEELVEHGEGGVRVLGPGLGLADPLGDRAEHLAEPLAIGAGSQSSFSP